MYCKMKPGVLKSLTLAWAKLHRRRMFMATKWLEALDHVLKLVPFYNNKVVENVLDCISPFFIFFRSIYGSWSISSGIVWQECWCFLVCIDCSWSKLVILTSCPKDAWLEFYCQNIRSYTICMNLLRLAKNSRIKLNSS